MEARAPFNATMTHSPSTLAPQRSPWHSPVPYLFGGLAAMLGLIAFALLILACSYWKLSGYLDGENSGDLESGERRKGDDEGSAGKPPPVYEEKILVIMAGDAKPSFLATPASSRSSSFGDNGSCVCQKTTDQTDVGNSRALETQTSTVDNSNNNNPEEQRPEVH